MAQRAVIKASNLLSEAFDKYSAGIITLEEFENRIQEIQNYLESKISVFGRYPEYSNRLFTTPIRDLRESIGAASKLLLQNLKNIMIFHTHNHTFFE